MTDVVMLVADSGEEAGLGHVSRSSAVAVALRSRGIETRCFALGAEGRFERDGVEWTPLADEQLPAARGTVLLVDSYRCPVHELERAASSTALVLFHDHGGVPEGAALVVSTSARLPGGDGAQLIGFEYAALRPAFWGLPRRMLRDTVERVLVTVGSGLFAELGSELARAVAGELPEARVTVVRGPHATSDALPGIAVLDAPDSLFEPLLDADLAISAAGQTMLEAAAAGTPCIAIALIANQREQALQLAERGAVRLVDPPDPRAVAAAAGELGPSLDARRKLSLSGQQTVDGYGAFRIAFHVARLAESSR